MFCTTLLGLPLQGGAVWMFSKPIVTVVNMSPRSRYQPAVHADLAGLII